MVEREVNRAGIEELAESKVVVFSLLVAALVVSGLLLTARPAHAATFTVNSTGDDGDATPDGVCNSSPTIIPRCTLREAIQEANFVSGADTINFNISGSGVHTISPTSQLPTIADPVTIDGYTQPGSSENMLADVASGTNAVLTIELDGSAATGGADGLTIGSGNTTIRGLVINRFKRSSGGLGGAGIVLKNISGNTNNVIEGNFIGTDPSGTVDEGNEGVGVGTGGSVTTDNTIGGASAEARNLISGNSGVGVVLSSNNTVQGNLVGTDKSSQNELHNFVGGIKVQGSGNVVAGNVVAFSNNDGVEVSSGTGNRILGNSIFSNGALGINLGNDGRTANDPKDPDTGPNNLQNFPELFSATTSTITGRLNSLPRKTFTIQFFSNPGGTDEGKTFIGEITVKTNRHGDRSFTFTPTQAVSSGDAITATATRNSTGDTSEFSDPVTVS